MSSNQDPSSRKPSGSSTHSAGYSPSSSPSNAQSQRKLNPASAGNMFGVGMGATGTIKGLNSGWQVWGNATPTSKRNASISSAASIPDQAEAHYRASIGETWNNTRPAGAWDEVNSSPQKKDMSQLDDRPSNLAKAGQFSPQRFDSSLGMDPNATSRYSSTMSPSKQGGYNSNSSPFSGQQPMLHGSTSGPSYDSNQTSSMVENELSMALRGMAVEDDYGVAQHAQYRQANASQPANQSRGAIPQIRLAHPMHQGGVQYSGYPQSDYSAYYPASPVGQAEYSYGYANPSDPSLYGSAGAMGSATSPTSMYPGVSPFTHVLMYSGSHINSRDSFMITLELVVRQRLNSSTPLIRPCYIKFLPTYRQW
ncbi:hypothetical protein JAAARDRAFT_708937 [Jaapia argillacea MUCL 33604]|uniref:Uncharacterized protein n=1 Tax=Jaapia argillacea MUCL 33604 TaxID=933084 RepID=A0A067Q156_9AGAM|nr:hypothetical protein JAAARDRAFT_708937 [Jaapia argillacea MUCL 33604]